MMFCMKLLLLITWFSLRGLVNMMSYVEKPRQFIYQFIGFGSVRMSI